jgi:hypothetical protein
MQLPSQHDAGLILPFELAQAVHLVLIAVLPPSTVGH